jgi:pSer/pThr/pTyr-binding forkhead associated (FHA) protein
MLPAVPSLATDGRTTTSFQAVKADEARPTPAERAQLEPGRYLIFGDARVETLDQEVTHVGRGFAADVVIENQTVSRRHAVLASGPDGLRILDDRSSNGTFVNGERVGEAQLRDGDLVAFGIVAARYVEIT